MFGDRFIVQSLPYYTIWGKCSRLKLLPQIPAN